MNIQNYWRQINELAATLPDEVWIVSIDNPDKNVRGGAVFAAEKKLAAERMVARTHILATKEQIEKFKAESDANVKRNQAIEQRRAPKTVLMVSPEEAERLVPEVTRPARKTA